MSHIVYINNIEQILEFNILIKVFAVEIKNMTQKTDIPKQPVNCVVFGSL